MSKRATAQQLPDFLQNLDSEDLNFTQLDRETDAPPIPVVSQEDGTYRIALDFSDLDNPDADTLVPPAPALENQIEITPFSTPAIIQQAIRAEMKRFETLLLISNHQKPADQINFIRGKVLPIKDRIKELEQALDISREIRSQTGSTLSNLLDMLLKEEDVEP